MIMGFSTRDVFGGAVIVQQMANTSAYAWKAISETEAEATFLQAD